MKVLENDLEITVERWSDPGDYPSGAGGGPLPSRNFVSGVDGSITVQLETADWTAIHQYADVGMTEEKMAAAWVNDNPGGVEHGVSGLTVSKWAVDDLRGDRLTLSVEDYEADAPEPPEPEYDPIDEIERRERRDQEPW